MEKTNSTFTLDQNKQVGRSLNPIEPRIRELVKSGNFYVIRRKKNNEPLNVSYSKFGLRWTTDRERNLLYFKRAQLRHKKDIEGNMIPYFWKYGVDGLEKSNDIYVEQFIPRDHYKIAEDGSITKTLDSRLQVAEYMFTSKALKMLYWVPQQDELVYSSNVDESDEESDPNIEI
jgi:hypothetical protein